MQATKGKVSKAAPVPVVASPAVVAVPAERAASPSQVLPHEEPPAPALLANVGYGASRSARVEQLSQDPVISGLVTGAGPALVNSHVAATSPVSPPAASVLPSMTHPAASLLSPPIPQPARVPSIEPTKPKVQLPTAPSTLAPTPPAPRPFRLLPLGPGAYLNNLLMGLCLNAPACLARHTINSDAHAAGVKPLLGERACINDFLAGACANGTSCLARQALSEDDYATQQAVVAPVASAPAPSPRPVAPAQPLADHASAGQSFANNGTNHDFRAIARPVSRVRPLPSHSTLSFAQLIENLMRTRRPTQLRPRSRPHQPPPPLQRSTNLYYLSRAVADLVILDDDEAEADLEKEAFDVSDSDDE